MRKLIFENTGLKISAVVLAVFLWLFVTSHGQSEISLEVPIEFKNIPQGLGIINNSAKTVIVTVRGQERMMKNLKPSDIRVSVDLDKARKGEAVYAIDKEDIKLPFAMTVTNVSPPTLKVRLEEMVTKSVEVRPLITGSPGRGYYVKAVEVVPKTVKVQGLKSEVRKIGELGTESFDITGLTDTSTEELGIDIPGGNLKAEVASVKVTVVIGGRKR